MSRTSKLALALALLVLATSARSEGPESNFMGQDAFGGISFTQAVSAPPIGGALVLEDGTSFLLLEDGASHLCFEGSAC